MKNMKKLLIKLYSKEKKTAKEIAEILGVKPCFIYKALKEYNIPKNKRIAWNEGKSKKTNPELNWGGNKVKNQIPWNKGLTKETDSRVKELAKKKEQWHKNKDYSGWNNPFYGKKHTEEFKSKQSLNKGGTGIPGEHSEYGAEFDNSLKEQVRFKDKYKCRGCNCPQIENGRQLDVHHIDYNKKNNNINNLISLCIGCHSKTNVNREYWKEYFINFQTKR